MTTKANKRVRTIRYRVAGLDMVATKLRTLCADYLTRTLDMTEGEFVRALHNHADAARLEMRAVTVKVKNINWVPYEQAPGIDYSRSATDPVVAWATEHGVLIDDTGAWYMVKDQSTGHVNGMPHTRGIRRITNGIMVYIETSSGEAIKGHMDSWVPDPKVPAIVRTNALRKAAKAERIEREYV